MGIQLDDLPDHEGYAARLLPDGTLTASWTADTKEFVAWVAACDCGLPGYSSHGRTTWYGTVEYPPTEDGREQALQEWKQTHADQLLQQAAPAGLSQRVTDLLTELQELMRTRPMSALPELRRIERHADRLLREAVTGARTQQQTWAEIGAALNMSRQSAHQRFSPGRP
jgi:hypothetical protein